MDAQFVHESESLMKRVDMSEIIEVFGNLPTSEDRPWYFSFTILAIYAYLDEYSRSIIKMMDEYPIFSSNSKLNIDEMKSSSIMGRLTKIYDIFTINSIISKYIDLDSVERFRDGLSRFIKIRGQVAHSNPRLNHDEYTFTELEREVDEIELDYSDVEKLIEKIGYTQYGISKIKDETKEIEPVANKLQLVVLMSTIFPALIDAVLSSMI